MRSGRSWRAARNRAAGDGGGGADGVRVEVVVVWWWVVVVKRSQFNQERAGGNRVEWHGSAPHQSQPRLRHARPPLPRACLPLSSARLRRTVDFNTPALWTRLKRPPPITPATVFGHDLRYNLRRASGDSLPPTMAIVPIHNIHGGERHPPSCSSRHMTSPNRVRLDAGALC